MKLAAAILAAGSALFQLGAFLPVARFYVSSLQERMTIMQEQHLQWRLHLAGMALGAIVTAAGLGLLVLRLPLGTPSLLGLVAFALVLAGTVLWVWHLRLRITDPTGFASGNNPMWHFAVYTVSMQAALLLLAAAFHQSGMPGWMVWALAGGTLFTILLLAILRDVPPFLHYVWLLAITIGLLLSAGPAEEQAGVSAPPMASDVKVVSAEPHHYQELLDESKS